MQWLYENVNALPPGYFYAPYRTYYRMDDLLALYGDEEPTLLDDKYACREINDDFYTNTTDST